jgi:AhpD family alkylhydroperoxidase
MSKPPTDRSAKTASWPIRKDLAHAHERAWRRLAEPGTWWDGAQRTAIANEARNAANCALCQSRKQALSPEAVDGRHDKLSDLPDAVIEVAHRVRTDSGRLTEAWYKRMLDRGMTDAQYVEIVGIAVTIAALDTFDRAIGRPETALLEPVSGPVSQRRPSGAKKTIAWVPTMDREDVAAGDQDPYRDLDYELFNIQKAMSLVPDEVAGFTELDEANYLTQPAIRDFATEYRALSHAQMEFLAARLAAINECFYCATSHTHVLQLSGQAAGENYDVGAVVAAQLEDGGVAHGKLLLEFGEAVLGTDDDRLATARQELADAIGSAAFVDACGVVASFNSIVRVANATGIPLEEFKQVPTRQMREQLGFSGFRSAENNRP